MMNTNRHKNTPMMIVGGSGGCSGCPGLFKGSVPLPLPLECDSIHFILGYLAGWLPPCMRDNMVCGQSGQTDTSTLHPLPFSFSTSWSRSCCGFARSVREISPCVVP